MRMTEYERRKERMDVANLAVSTASLGLAAAALCLNEKPLRGDDRMSSRIEPSRYGNRKDLKKAYRAEIKRTAATEIGYTGPVIVLNENGRDVRYGIVPLDEGSREKAPSSKRSWVAMEMNARTGGDRQAVVCSSRAEAEERATAMKRAHKKGSAKSRDCVQGYARMDVSGPIDVRAWLDGSKGTVYGV